jgi:hypothetical protein
VRKAIRREWTRIQRRRWNSGTAGSRPSASTSRARLTLSARVPISSHTLPIPPHLVFGNTLAFRGAFRQTFDERRLVTYLSETA